MAASADGVVHRPGLREAVVVPARRGRHLGERLREGLDSKGHTVVVGHARGILHHTLLSMTVIGMMHQAGERNLATAQRAFDVVFDRVLATLSRL